MAIDSINQTLAQIQQQQAVQKTEAAVDTKAVGETAKPSAPPPTDTVRLSW